MGLEYLPVHEGEGRGIRRVRRERVAVSAVQARGDVTLTAATDITLSVQYVHVY